MNGYDDEPRLATERMPLGAAERALQNGQAMQRVQTTYCTALSVQKPRVLADVRRRLLEEAALAGDDFFYGWGAGKDRIEGKSQALAHTLARCWGNCVIEQLPVQDMPDCWIFTAHFIDLETGYTLARQFRQSKNWVVYGKLDEERKADIRFEIGQSKATRNVILKALPERLADEAIEKAKEGLKARIDKWVADKGIVHAVDAMLRALAKYGVKEPAVLHKCGVADRKALDVDHLVILRSDLNALESGQEHAENLFPGMQTAAASAEEKLRGGKPANGSAETPKSEPPKTESPKPDLAAQERQKLADHFRQRIAEAQPIQMDAIQGDIVAHEQDLEWELYDQLVKLHEARAKELQAAAGKGGKKGRDF